MNRRTACLCLIPAMLTGILTGAGNTGDPYEDQRIRMVRQQITARGIRDKPVLEAMKQVPRHRLVPLELVNRAYGDHPLPIGHGQTISQPYIVALMTHLLEVGPDSRVLEIGTGSGYQAAVLAEIVKSVTTIEIIGALARQAERRLGELGYDNVTVIHADGYFGLPEEAPFDAIIVTAAAEHIPPPLIAQLKPGGRMVIPVGRMGWTQNLMLVEKREDGSIRTRNELSVMFVPLTRDKK